MVGTAHIALVVAVPGNAYSGAVAGGVADCVPEPGVAEGTHRHVPSAQDMVTVVGRGSVSALMHSWYASTHPAASVCSL